MNIQLNINPELVIRIACALERIAATLSCAIPPAPQTSQDKPYGREFFSVASNRSSYDQEVAEFLEAKGYGRDYDRKLKEVHKQALDPGPHPGPTLDREGNFR